MEKFSIQRIHDSFDKKEKGFTLVEVIVVLVILAILAALLVPKLTGWITEAKNKAATGEAHLVLSAAQAYASEEYAKGETPDTFDYDNISKYVEGDIAPGTKEESSISGGKIVDGKVTAFTYKATNGVSITYSYSADAAKGEFTLAASK